MQRKGFDILRESEDSWWFAGRRLIASKIMKKYCRSTGGHILDFGSGFGGMLQVLSRFGSVSAFEPNDEAREVAEGRGYSKVFSNVDEALADNDHYSAIALFDVVEHIEDDKGFITRAHKNLSAGGKIIITVPAFQWLWSNHDIEHNHFRRYSKKEIDKLVEECGFSIEYSGYWNFFLFPPALLVRLSGRSGSDSLSSAFFLNKIFLAIVRLESMLIPALSLPFGTGIILVAKKHNP